MHVRTGLFAALLALALASPAFAQLNLSWDDCGAAGQELKTWTCDANPDVIARCYASFVLPPGAPVTALTGLEGRLVILSSGGTLPAWWQIGTFVPGSCRPNGMAVDFTLPCAHAIDYWDSVPGGALGGFAYYYAGAYSGIPEGGALIRTVQAVDQRFAGPIGPGEYYAFTVTLKGQNTTGPGACAGCSTPMAIALQTITLTQPVGVGDYVFSTSDGRQYIEWQCPGFPVTSAPGFAFDCTTPAKPKTWGQVKALYR